MSPKLGAGRRTSLRRPQFPAAPEFQYAAILAVTAVGDQRLARASRIVAIDINDGKLDFARRFGATDTINNADGSALE